MTEVWHIYVALFIRAVAGGFHQSAFGASGVLLVPKEHLARVQGFNQALYGGLNIISAPLGALLISVLPMQGILGIDIGTALLAITILLFIQIPQPERSAQTPSTFWQDFAAGFRYISAWRGLVILLGLVMVINFFFSATEPLTPLLITQHFKGDAQKLAWWLSSFAIGTVLGGVILGAWGGFKRKVVTAQTGLILTGLSTIVVGIVSSDLFWLGLIANTIVGLLLPIINGSFGATLQATIAPEMQGRVFAFILSAASLVSPLALIIAGPFADAFGIQLWFLIAGIACTLMGIAGFFSSEVMGMENKSSAEHSGASTCCHRTFLILIPCGIIPTLIKQKQNSAKHFCTFQKMILLSLNYLPRLPDAQGLQRKFEKAHQTLDQVERRLGDSASHAKVRYLIGAR